MSLRIAPAAALPQTPLALLRAEWRDVARAVWQEVRADNLTLVAAGVGFYALLAIFPAVAAVVALYGLVAAPETVREHLSLVSTILPTEAYQLLAEQVHALTTQAGTSLGFGFVIGLGLSLWSGSRAVLALMTAINIAYERQEQRGALLLNLLAAALTLAAIMVMLGAMALLGGLPAAVEARDAPAWVGWSILLLRWPPLGGIVLMALAVLYRFGAYRPGAPFEWLTPGAVLAMAFWLAASAGFSIYVANFGRYNETFGSLGAGVILLLWFYFSAFTVCVGAEINAEVDARLARYAKPA